MKGRRITTIVIVALMLGVLVFQTVSAQQSTERFRANITGDDFYTDEGRMNIANTQNMTTNKDIWKSDMGKIPKGVYRGPLLPPHSVEIDYKPRWRNKYNHGADETKGTFGYTNMIHTVNVSSNKIMNGASEFWMQVPVDADSLYNFDVKYTDAGDDVHLNKYYSSVQIFKGDVGNVRTDFTHMRGTRILQYSEAELNGNTVTADMWAIIRPQDVYNDRPYVKINGFFESDTTYTVVYNLITKDKKPNIYTTSSNNFGNTTFQFCKQEITNTNLETDHTNDLLSESEDMSVAYNVVDDGEKPVVVEKKTGLKLATSFIFTSGIGKEYLFGEEITFEKGDMLQFYPDMNWGNAVSGGDNRPSFYLPFISNQGLGGSAVDINISYANRYAEWNSSTAHLHHNGEITWKFKDYILFSDSKRWKDKGADEGNCFQIHFREKTTLTLLFSAKEFEYTNTTSFGKSRSETQNRFRESHMFHVSDNATNEIYPKEYPNTEEVYTYQGTYRPYFYQPYIVGEILPEGYWGQVNASAEGMEKYTHSFEASNYYSNMEFKVQTDDGRSITTVIKWGAVAYKSIAFTQAENLYEFVFPSSDGKNALDNMKGALSKVATRLWEGAKTIYAKIVDGLKWIWEGIQKLVNIITTKIIEFVDWLKGFIQDIADVLGVLAERLAYIGGMLGFVFIAGTVGKTIKMSDWGYMEGGERR